MADFKKVTLTNEAFSEIYEALNVIGNKPDLDISWGLARNIQKGKPHYLAFQKEIHDMQHKLGQKHPNGTIVMDERGNVKFDNMELAEKAMQEIGEKQIEVEIFEIDKSKFPDSCFTKIPANFLAILMDVVIIENNGLKKA